jgi:hypothetical protein
MRLLCKGLNNRVAIFGAKKCIFMKTGCKMRSFKGLNNKAVRGEYQLFITRKSTAKRGMEPPNSPMVIIQWIGQ